MSTSAIVTRGYLAGVHYIPLRGFVSDAASEVEDYAPIEERSQQQEVGIFIDLFSLDLTSLGGGVIYWTPSRPKSGQPIIWQGNNYTSVDITASGFDQTTAGVTPRPQITISNADGIAGVLLTIYKDLLGCTVTRTRTLYEYLDDQPNADPSQYWPLDIYRVERKVSANKNQVTMELASAADNTGAKIPRLVVIRELCSLVYRRYSADSFDYTKATCPYTGTACYNRLGVSVPDANDACGKRLSDCRLRFGSDGELPFGGFPGVGRIKL